MKSEIFTNNLNLKGLIQTTLFLFVLLISHSTFSQSEDKVFYSSFRPEGWDIYLSKNDGKSFEAFTKHESLDYDAKISPDGQWVVFTSERLGSPNLFIKHIEGDTLPRLLVKSNSMQDQVDISPDGKSMVFVSTHEGNADIYKLPFKPLDTLFISDAQNLTNDKGGDFRPKFSHDGSKIAFSSDRAHDTKPHRFFPFAMQRTADIYTMDAEGGAVKRLTDEDAWDGSPIWSLDDREIYFYSDENDILALYKMNAGGDSRQLLLDPGFDCLSPVLRGKNQILFTSIANESKVFAIVGFDMNTKKIDSSFVDNRNMLNAYSHPNGLMVYHGGKKPEDTEENKSGFSGDLLVKNNPEVSDLLGKPIELFGVRRAFAAPPTPDGTQIVYDHLPANSPMDLMTPYIYVLALVVLLALIWFIIGSVRSIKRRKTIAPWKYLLFSVLSLIVAVAILGTLYYQFIVLQVSLTNVKWTFLGIGIFLIAVYFLFRKTAKKRRLAKQVSAPLFKSYALMLGASGIMAVYVGLFCNSFFSVEPDFYSVNRQTKEVEHLFKFKADASTNPLLARIIDTKFTPDGEYLQFSVGGFRANPSAQGAVYKYHFKEKTLEKITDSDSNNAFADFSDDNASMVFRSGRTGNMDIYLRENDTTINLTNSPDRENFPIISHDGNKIAFCSDVNGTDKKGIIKTVDLYVMERQPNNSWSEPKQITTYTGQEGHPHFSPDGEWLIFTTEAYGINDEQPIVQSYIFSPQLYGEITAIQLKDGKEVRLTHNKWEDGAPLWINND